MNEALNIKRVCLDILSNIDKHCVGEEGSGVGVVHVFGSMNHFSRRTG